MSCHYFSRGVKGNAGSVETSGAVLSGQGPASFLPETHDTVLARVG